MKKLLYILCVVTILASCNKSEEVALDDTPEGKTRLTIALNQENNSPARKIFGTTKGSAGMDFKWEEGDVIIVEVADAQHVAKAGTQSEFTMISLVDNVATFEGELPDKVEGEFYHVIAGDTKNTLPSKNATVRKHETDLLPNNVMRFESDYYDSFDQTQIQLHAVWAIIRLDVRTNIKDKKTILGDEDDISLKPDLKFQINGTMSGKQQSYTFTPSAKPTCTYDEGSSVVICYFLILEPGTYSNASLGIYYKSNDPIILGNESWVTSKTETINIDGVSYHGKSVGGKTFVLDKNNFLPINVTDYYFEFEAN